MLAAEELRAERNKGSAEGTKRAFERAGKLPEDQVNFWGAVLGFVCELSGDPLAVLKQVNGVSPELTLRVLPELELRGDQIDEVLELFARAVGWDRDYLLQLVRGWLDGGDNVKMAPAQVHGWLWRQVDDECSLLKLSYLHYVLDEAFTQEELKDKHVSTEEGYKEFFNKCKKNGPLPGGIVWNWHRMFSWACTGKSARKRRIHTTMVCSAIVAPGPRRSAASQH